MDRLFLGLPLDNIAAALSRVFTDGFTLLAMPLFIPTGNLITQSGISRRLTDYAYACLGWIRSGLAIAALAACGQLGHHGLHAAPGNGEGRL